MPAPLLQQSYSIICLGITTNYFHFYTVYHQTITGCTIFGANLREADGKETMFCYNVRQ